MGAEEQELEEQGQEQEEQEQEEQKEQEELEEQEEQGGQEEQRRQDVILTFATLDVSCDMSTIGPQAPAPVLVASITERVSCITEGGGSHTSPVTLTHLQTLSLTPDLMDLQQLDSVNQSTEFVYDSLDSIFG